MIIWNERKNRRKDRYYRLLCNGFDPVGTLLFSDLKYSLACPWVGASSGGRKTCWLAKESRGKLCRAAWTVIGVKTRRKAMKRERWKWFIAEKYVRGIWDRKQIELWPKALGHLYMDKVGPRLIFPYVICRHFNFWSSLASLPYDPIHHKSWWWATRVDTVRSRSDGHQFSKVWIYDSLVKHGIPSLKWRLRVVVGVANSMGTVTKKIYHTKKLASMWKLESKVVPNEMTKMPIDFEGQLINTLVYNPTLKGILVKKKSKIECRRTQLGL